MKQPDKDKVPFKFWSKINEITKYVRDKFQLHMWCDFDQMRFENKQEELVVEKTQPYTTLVLADLVYAHGAQDEGIEVLADWLTKNRNEKVVPQWWALRVESRIALWMADVAGQNNVAYRSFINTYKDHLQEYFEHSTATKTMNSHHVSLDQLDARCKIWEAGDFDSKARGSSLRSSRDAVVSDEKQLTINSQNAVMAEQKAFFLLLSAEDESLRTELNFIGEEGAFDTLEDLNLRATTLVRFGPECLPKTEDFDQELREATIADHKVTAGLVGLTVAERMHTLARSRGDHNRATDIARNAEELLRVGYALLFDRVKRDREQDMKKDWNKQIFSQSNWEKSVNLASRALLQLRSKD